MAELQNLVVTGDAVIVGKLRVSGDAEIVAPEAETAKVAEVAQVANRLASPIVIDGLTVDGTTDVVAYTECETAGATAAKTATLEGFSLVYGAETTVKFINANTATNPTLNINGTENVPIHYRGAAIPADYIVSNSTLVFRYNGSAFDVVGEIVTSRVDDLEEQMGSHTHKYAGSSTVGGAANSANKLNTDAGNASTPVYFANGIPVPVTSISVSTTGNAATADKADEATTLTGMNASVTELNYVKGVTSNIQTQLDGKADEDHTHDAAGTGLGFVKSGGDVTISNGVITVKDDSHNHVISNVDGLQTALDGKETAGAAAKALSDANAYTDKEIAALIGTAPELRDTLGELNDAIKDNADVIAVLEQTASGKAPLEHTHNYAGSSTPGGAATSADKLNTNAGDASTPVYFANGVPVPVTSIKVNVSGNAETADKAATADTATTLTGLTASVTELNYVDGVTSNIQTQLDNKADEDHGHAYSELSGLPTIPSKTSQLTNDSGYVVNTTAAGTGLGLVKSGGDVTITGGVITVNDDSHAHVIGNVDGLQSALDGKSDTDHTHSYAGAASAGGAATSANKLNTDAGDSNTPVYFKDGVPVAVTGLDLDTTGNAATATNAANAATATTLTGLTATVSELNYVDGVTSPIQTQLNNKSDSDHEHSYNDLNDLPTIPSKTSQLTNDSGYVVNTTAAGTGLGLVKSGGDVTISSGVITVKDDSHNHVISNVDGLQSALDDKSDTDHTHNYAGSSSVGGAATSADKLNTDAGDSTTPVYFKDGVPVAVTSIKVNVSGNAETATHANSATTAETATRANSAATADTATTLTGLTSTVTELNYVDGVTSNIQTQLDNKADEDHTHNAAGSTLGFVKSGGDVTISNGVITVKDDSHAHVISNVDGLQSALDGKSGTDHTHNYAGSSTVGGAANSANKLNTDAGDSTTPVYFKDGIPVAVTSIKVNVSGNAETATHADSATTLDGLTATVTELNYVDGVTSSIQTQLNNKSDSDHQHSYSELNGLPTIPSKVSQLTNDAGYVTTDTTYSEATSTVSGLMSADDKAKLDTVAENANNYKHPSYTAKSSGFYKVTVDGSGHVSAATAVTKSDITDLGIPAQDTTYSVATTSAAGLMSASDKTKLNGIATGANKTVVDTAMSTTSTNPVQNKVVQAALTALKEEITETTDSISSTVGSHTHDDRYYTETEIDTLLGKKEAAGAASTALTNAKSYTDQKVSALTTVVNGKETAGAAAKALADANAYTDKEIAALVGTASETRDTLGELSDAIKDNADVIAVLEETAAGKAPLVHSHDAATTSANGFMSSTDKSKLDGIAAGANKYTHPTHTAKSNGFYKVTVDASGHVSGTTAVAKSDITALGIPAQDTTYSDATTSTAGLMSAADKTKLNGIATGANKYTHPTHTAASSGLYKVTVDGSGHVSATTEVAKDDITALGIPAQDTTYSAATTSAAGLMSASDKSKLNGIATGAEVNQNAFTNVVVGSTTIAADSKTDTLTIAAGSNVTITPDATNDKITIAATDTTYSAATTSTAGLMSADDKTKLNGIATGANKYTHPSYTAKSSGFYKVTVDASGHVSGATAVAKSDITALGIPAQDTTYSAATTSAAGLMSTGDKSKLDGIATGAEVNQNAFSNITVGTTTIAADAKTDTLTLVAGSNVTITPDATNDKITIAATDTTYSAATTSAAGLMSTSDKSKLDGIATGANKYTHPSYTAKSSGFYKVTVDASGHVSGTAAVAKSDITALGIPAQDTTYSAATTSAAGLMSAADKTKLNNIGIATDAQIQALFS